MGLRLFDYRCDKCSTKVLDHLTETGEVVKCPKNPQHGPMTIQPGATKQVWPPYVSPGSKR